MLLTFSDYTDYFAEFHLTGMAKEIYLAVAEKPLRDFFAKNDGNPFSQ